MIRPPIQCPACGRRHEAAQDTAYDCPGCRRRVDVRFFSPIALKVEEAAPALPDDAVCAHHPSKRADHVCAGTGAYICQLCAVHSEGEIVSAAYLNTQAGKTRTQAMFAVELPRPDSLVGLFCLLMFVPYVGCLGMIASPFVIPYSFVLLARAARLRREGEPAYARIIRPWKLWVKGIWLGLLGLGLLAWIAVLIFGLAFGRP